MRRNSLPIVFLLLVCFNFGSAKGQESPVLEICLAQSEAIDGWKEMAVDGKAPIFVKPESVIDMNDILSVKVKEEAGRKGVTLRLTRGGGKKLAATSSANLKKLMAIIYRGKVVAAPKIQSEIGRNVLISGDFSDEQIEEIVASLEPRPTMPSFSEEELEALSKRLDRAFEKRILSGTVLIAVDGKIVFEKSVGFAKVDDEIPFAKNSSFRLASVSKQFTAMGIMLLKEDGKLDFDDDIREFLPSLPYEGITIRHLLYHNGGLTDYMWLFNEHWDKGVEESKKKTAFNADMVTLFAEQKPKPLFEPGEKHRYSNTGYVLLGSIIEVASGQGIHEFFKSRIFEPLEMTDSFAFSPDEKLFKPENRVFGFVWDGKDSFVANDWHYLNGMVGDGGIYSSARDLLKWDQALYGDKLVSKETLDEAFTSGKLNSGRKTGYGFGWLVQKSKRRGLIVSHGGSWVGFRTSISREVDRKLTVIVLSNNSTDQLDGVTAAIDEL